MAKANPRTRSSKTAKQDGKSLRAVGAKVQPRRSTSRRKTSAHASRANGSGDSRTMAQNFLSRGKTALGDAYHWAETASHGVPRTAMDASTRGVQSARAILEQNPLVLAVIGLGIGLAVSAMIPNSRIPNPLASRPGSRAQGRRRGTAAASRR